MALGTIKGNIVIVAQYGPRVECMGRILYNPTEDTYRAMGFGTLPTAEPQDGWHDEWYVEDGAIKARAVENAPAPEQELKRKFTKGELLEALKACGLYDAAKAIYESDVDLRIAFAGFADIDMDYLVFQDFMEKYPELFTEQNVNMLQRYITFKEIPE